MQPSLSCMGSSSISIHRQARVPSVSAGLMFLDARKFIYKCMVVLCSRISPPLASASTSADDLSLLKMVQSEKCFPSESSEANASTLGLTSFFFLVILLSLSDDAVRVWAISLPTTYYIRWPCFCISLPTEVINCVFHLSARKLSLTLLLSSSSSRI